MPLVLLSLMNPGAAWAACEDARPLPNVCNKINTPIVKTSSYALCFLVSQIYLNRCQKVTRKREPQWLFQNELRCVAKQFHANIQ